MTDQARRRLEDLAKMTSTEEPLTTLAIAG
jgi:hypothetical protein